MQFAYSLCIALYALLSATQQCNFQGFFIMNFRHSSAQKLKDIFNKCHLNDLLCFTLKSEVDTKLVQNIAIKWAHQVVWCFVKYNNIK